MEDMATPQPTRLDQLGKTYSSYFRPDDVKVLAITTNWDGEKKEEKKRNGHIRSVTSICIGAACNVRSLFINISTVHIHGRYEKQVDEVEYNW